MRPALVIMIGSLCALLTGCDKGAATLSPDSSAPAQTAPSEPEAPQEASPALVASYTDMVHEVYSSDAERCLVEQMEAEDTRYMRAAYTMTIGVTADGSTEGVEASEVRVQILSYGGEVLKDGDAESMGDCLVTAAADWEFEPQPPSTTTFLVNGAVGG